MTFEEALQAADDSPERRAALLGRIGPVPRGHVTMVFSWHDGSESRPLRAEEAGDPAFERVREHCESRGICVYFIACGGEMIYRTPECVGGWVKRPVKCSRAAP